MNQYRNSKLLDTGIDAIGDIPWGTHFCHFYETPQDLHDIVIPFLRAGLNHDESCLWVVADQSGESENALRQGIPDIDRHLASGNIKVLPYTEVFLKGGGFDQHRILEDWEAELSKALDNGRTGIRLAADGAWITDRYWEAFAEFEQSVDQKIAGLRMNALCAYPISSNDAGAIFDVVRTHQFVVAMRRGQWQVLETPELIRSKAELQKLNSELDRRVTARTRELAKSERKFRALFEHSQSAVFITRADGTIEAANPAACAMFGRPPQELCASDCSGILDAEDPRFSAALKARQKVGRVTSAELMAIHKDGNTFPVEADSVILPDEPARSFFILRNITERKQAEQALLESEARLSAILNQLPVGVGVIDTDGRAILRNDLMRTYMQSMVPSRDPEQRKRWHGFDSAGNQLPPDQWPAARALRGESVVSGIEFTHTDDHGRDFWRMVSAVPFSSRQGSKVGAIVVVQDISELKKAERDLRETNRELNEYTYALTHNVKAPFRAIQNYASFLLEDLGGMLAGEPRQFLDGIKKAVAQAQQQFSDLDALYRIRKHEVDFEPVDMRAFLEEIAATYPDASHRQLIISDRWPVVRTEPFLLRQILMALIENGFKYNQSAEKRVEIGWQRTTDRFEFFVRDNGIGIDPRYHNHIFYIFKRLHTEEEYEGTGIGLAIVRKSVKKIGGELRIESVVGEGSTFAVSLPAAMVEDGRRDDWSVETDILRADF